MIRNFEIDRLRAIAVVATIYAHISDLWMWSIPLLELLKKYLNGYDGVLLFFSISGFVISASLIPKLDFSLVNKKGKLLVLGAFFTKRFFRITPTAFFWILFTLGVMFLVDPRSIEGNIYAAIAALFNYFNIYTVFPDRLPNSFGIYWSLSLEEQFYFVLPVLLILFRSFGRRLSVLIFFVGSLWFIPSWLIGAFQIVPIAGGVALYLIDKKFNLIEKLKKSEIFSRKILVIISFFLILSVLGIRKFMPNGLIHLLVMGFVCPSLVLIALLNKDAIIPFKSKIVDWLGNRSFTLYLSHLPMIFLVRYLFMNFGNYFGVQYSNDYNVEIFLVWVLLTYLITEFSYYFVEKPMMNKGKVLASKIEAGFLRVFKQELNKA